MPAPLLRRSAAWRRGLTCGRRAPERADAGSCEPRPSHRASAGYCARPAARNDAEPWTRAKRLAPPRERGESQVIVRARGIAGRRARAGCRRLHPPRHASAGCRARGRPFTLRAHKWRANQVFEKYWLHSTSFGHVIEHFFSYCSLILSNYRKTDRKLDRQAAEAPVSFPSTREDVWGQRESAGDGQSGDGRRAGARVEGAGRARRRTARATSPRARGRD